jgi:three-Cys-motif partner protein
VSHKNKKYDWEIGSELPQLDEHSETKHLIIADYLKRYVEVYMASATIERLPLTVVDGFAGGGKYRAFNRNETTDGSPFLILKSIQEAEALLNIGRRKPRSIDAEYHFIEKDAPHLDFLRQELHLSEFAHLLDSKIHLYNKKFDQVATDVIKRIQQRNKGMRAIFILDQYAYKDVPFSIIRNIFSSTASEVILTFNFDTLQSFLAENSTNKKALENINLSQYIDWNRLALFKEAGMWQHAIQEQLANAILKGSGANHMTLFFIKPKKGWCYWLVHLSQKFIARDVMMSLHWKHSNTSAGFEHHLGEGIFTLGYQATQTAGQITLDFGEAFDFGSKAKERCIERLSESIPRLLDNCNVQMPFSQLTDNIGSLTPASTIEIKAALQSSIDNKELMIVTKDGGTRRSANQIGPSDILKYNQKQLFF